MTWKLFFTRLAAVPKLRTIIAREFVGLRPLRLRHFLRARAHGKQKFGGVIASRFGYDLSRSVVDIRKTYQFNESCQQTVPEAITAFLESQDYENAIRLAISLGGDADTLACITGGIAGAFYGSVPRHIAEPAWALLDHKLRSVVTSFCNRYNILEVVAR